MRWDILETEKQIEEIQTLSAVRPVLIYKHSAYCQISHSVLQKLETSWQAEEMGNVLPYFLDLHAYRSVSDTIASSFGVIHESPQVLIIHKGKAIYESSHFEISYHRLKEIIGKQQ